MINEITSLIEKQNKIIKTGKIFSVISSFFHIYVFLTCSGAVLMVYMPMIQPELTKYEFFEENLSRFLGQIIPFILLGRIFHSKKKTAELLQENVAMLKRIREEKSQ